jgi:hypothetical protein
MSTESNIIESYVIRIYRRTDSDPQQAIGIAERTEDGRQQHFSTMQQLWEILMAGEKANHAHLPQDQ